MIVLSTWDLNCIKQKIGTLSGQRSQNFLLLNTLRLVNVEMIIDGTGFKDREETAEIQALAKKENIRFVFLKYVVGVKSVCSGDLVRCDIF